MASDLLAVDQLIPVDRLRAELDLNEAVVAALAETALGPLVSWLHDEAGAASFKAVEVKSFRFSTELEAKLRAAGQEPDRFYLGVGEPPPASELVEQQLLLDNCPRCFRRGYHLARCPLLQLERVAMRRGAPRPLLQLIEARRG